MQKINNNNYNIWSKQLSQAWGNQDLSKDHYDYRKYYNDQPIVAWLQLNSILAHNWNRYIPTGHFPDEGASGTYKTKTHPTYPDLGDKSWSRDNKIYYLSKDQYIKPNSGQPLDYTMDYLGSDYDYNNGGTKVVYDGANVLPTLYITKTKGSGFNLNPIKIIMDTYILTEKIEELQRFLDFVSERDKQLWDKYLKKYETGD